MPRHYRIHSAAGHLLKLGPSNLNSYGEANVWRGRGRREIMQPLPWDGAGRDALEAAMRERCRLRGGLVLMALGSLLMIGACAPAPAAAPSASAPAASAPAAAPAQPAAGAQSAAAAQPAAGSQ